VEHRIALDTTDTCPNAHSTARPTAATDTRDCILKAYAYRMWIEEMFGDFKKNGFDF
jgi:hypothetical protein